MIPGNVKPGQVVTFSLLGQAIAVVVNVDEGFATMLVIYQENALLEEGEVMIHEVAWVKSTWDLL